MRAYVSRLTINRGDCGRWLFWGCSGLTDWQRCYFRLLDDDRARVFNAINFLGIWVGSLIITGCSSDDIGQSLLKAIHVERGLLSRGILRRCGLEVDTGQGHELLLGL